MADYLSEVIDQVRAEEYQRERTLQSGVGWSGMAGCRAYMGFLIRGEYATEDRDEWPAVAGTALHEWLTGVRQRAVPDQVIEFDVPTSFGGVPGHADEVIAGPARFEVTDYKFLKLASARLWRDPEVLAEKMIQPHGYAAGLVGEWLAAGLIKRPQDVTVRLMICPVDGTFADWWSHEEPFQPEIAAEAVARYEHVKEAVAAGDPLPQDKPWHWCEHVCLAGETEIVTRWGIARIQDAVGLQTLLVPSDGHGGVWRTCVIRSFGMAPLCAVKLRRGKETRIVHATSDHRWITADGSVVPTSELTSGTALRSIRRKAGPVAEVRFAVAQGFVYGDGCAASGNRDCAASVGFFPNSPKWESMSSYFAGHRVVESPDGRRLIPMIPRSWKQAPDLEESRAFLTSWLAGYIAADGHVSDRGQTTISSARRESLDLVRSICAIVGVGYSAITVESRIGINQSAPSDLYRVTISTRDLPEWVFKHPHHRSRAAIARQRKSYDRRWRVESVESTGRVDEVYCAEVPDVASFALTEELLTHNCEYFSACRGGPEPEKLPEITDPETAAAVESYGLAAEAYREADKAKKQLRPLIEGMRGQARGWRVSTGKGGSAEIPDLDQIRADYESSDLPLPVIRQPRAGQLRVTRIK